MKTWLVTIAVLLCSMGMSAATYSDWTSTNKGQSNTTSSNSYTITANAGDLLTFDWLVSSESQYDKLIITIGGTEILNKSGELSGTYQHTFTSSGSYTMEVKYTKDGSVDRGSDYAMIYNITFNRGNSGTCGTNLTWELTNEGELIIEGTGEMTSCPWDGNYESEIKTVIIGEGVTSIGNEAFYNCSNLTSITIPESVTSIGYSAFYDCSSLTAITLPEGVTNIGYHAFYGCGSLTAVHISDIAAWCNIKFFDYYSNPLYYAHSLYLNGELVTQLTLPEGVTSIGELAFRGCSSLTSITLPEGVTSIGNTAFSGCSSLTAITLPEGVTSIESGAFYCCTSLTSITLPESVASIGGTAFAYCRSLTAITLPEGVMSIGWYAFDGCRSLTAITFPEDVTSIGDGAFNCCSSLTSINIPESVTSIGESVFCDCI